MTEKNLIRRVERLEQYLQPVKIPHGLVDELREDLKQLIARIEKEREERKEAGRDESARKNGQQ